jgi:hypothetical protein
MNRRSALGGLGTILSRAAAVAALAVSTLVVAGCGADYDRTDITAIKPSPLGGNMNYTRIEVPVGMILKARIVSYDDDREEMDADIRVKDTSIVEATGVVSNGDYAFLGLRPGTTEVEIRADGKLVLIVTAIVTPQPALP